MTTLTPKGVYKLQPGQYWDRIQGGLVLDVKAKGKASWLIKGSMYVAPYVNKKGKLTNRRDITVRIGDLGTLGLEAARKTAAPLVAAMKEGINPKYVAEDRAVTLQQAYELFRDNRKAKKTASRTHTKNVLSYGNLYTADWLPMPLVKITPKMVAEKYAEVTEKNGPSSAENWRKTFTAVWNVQRKRMPTLPECPNSGIERAEPEHENEDKEQKSIPDLKAWWGHVLNHPNKLTSAALRFQLLSGLRSHNVWRLRREWLDISERKCRFPASAMKARKKFDLPLSQPMLDIIEEARQLWDGEFVFSIGDYSDNTRAWAQKRGPLAGLTGHVVRHEYSNVLVEMEVDVLKQYMLMAHELPGLKMKATYTNTASHFRALLKTQEEVSETILKKVLATPPVGVL